MSKNEQDLKKLLDANSQLMIALRLMTQLNDLKIAQPVAKAINRAMDINEAAISEANRKIEMEGEK